MKNKDEQVDELITVPRRWFESLLESSNRAQLALDKYEYGVNRSNDRLMPNIASLIGYTSSSESILNNPNLNNHANKNNSKKHSV
jgi:hypothetical protein